MASEGSEDWPFYTEEIDDVEVAGVVFNPKDGGFYEFQDPDTHDDYERVEDPRTGDVMTWGSKVEHMMGEILSGHVRATVPAEEWDEFRSDYVGAGEEDYEAWADRWRQMAEADPRFEGGAYDSTCNHCGHEPPEGSVSDLDDDLGPTCPECGHPMNDPKALDA